MHMQWQYQCYVVVPCCAIHPLVLFYHYEHSLCSAWIHFLQDAEAATLYKKSQKFHPFQAAFCLFFVALYLRPKFANVVDKGYEANFLIAQHRSFKQFVARRRKTEVLVVLQQSLCAIPWSSDDFLFWREKIIREWFFSEIKIRDVLFYSHFFLGFGWTRISLFFTKLISKDCLMAKMFRPAKVQTLQAQCRVIRRQWRKRKHNYSSRTMFFLVTVGVGGFGNSWNEVCETGIGWAFAEAVPGRNGKKLSERESSMYGMCAVS